MSAHPTTSDKAKSQTPKQAPTPEATAEIVAALTQAADDDGYKLTRLANIVKLAAFACEARRTLGAIEAAGSYRKSVGEYVAESVPAWRGWTTLEDTAGSVLDYVGMEMESLAEEIELRPRLLLKVATVGSVYD